MPFGMRCCKILVKNSTTHSKFTIYIFIIKSHRNLLFSLQYQVVFKKIKSIGNEPSKPIILQLYFCLKYPVQEKE